LQDIDERVGPAIRTAKWLQKKMYVVGHDDYCVEMNSRSGAGTIACERKDGTLPQTVFENQASCRSREYKWSARAEGDEQICIRLL
jgi:hypothetical protein